MKTNLTIQNVIELSLLMDMIVSEHLLTDRREYDSDDLRLAYDISSDQADTLLLMIEMECHRHRTMQPDWPTNDDDKTIEIRRFDDSSFCINPILLYLMSLDYAIINVMSATNDERYDIQLMMPDFSAFPNEHPLDPMRRYATIHVESEGATLTIHESHE